MGNESGRGSSASTGGPADYPKANAPRTAGVSDPSPRVPRASPRPPTHYGSAVGERALLKTANLTRGRPSRSQPPTRHSRRIATRSFALPTDFGTGRLFRRLTASAVRSLRTRFCAATCALSWSASEFHRNDPDLGSRGRSWFEGSPQVLLRPTC